MENYEFCVQIWFEEDVWNWSIVQEFESLDEVEVLAYGTADTRQEARLAVSQELNLINF